MLTKREAYPIYKNISFKIDKRLFFKHPCFSGVSDNNIKNKKKLIYTIDYEEFLVDKNTAKKYVKYLKKIFKFSSKFRANECSFYFKIKKDTESAELLLPLTALRFLQQYVKGRNNGGVVVECFLKLIKMFPEKNLLHLLTLADNKQIPHLKCTAHSLTFNSKYLSNDNCELKFIENSINKKKRKNDISRADLKILKSIKI